MVDYKQILRLRAEGVSQRGIAEALGCSRNTVAAVFVSANTAGVGFGEVAELGADEVRKLLLPGPSASVSDRAVPDFEYVHRELSRPSVTLLLLWNEYVARCRQSGEVPYQYSFFNEQYRRWAKATGASMRILRNPGESVEGRGSPPPAAPRLTQPRHDGSALNGTVAHPPTEHRLPTSVISTLGPVTRLRIGSRASRMPSH